MEFIDIEDIIGTKKARRAKEKYGEGIFPVTIFDGGAFFYDDHVFWVVFDNEPTLTFDEVKEWAEVWDCVPDDDCNPEDYKTWSFWLD